MLLRPTKKTTPDEWAAENREYPATSGHPGKRNPRLTPYVVAFGRAAFSNHYKRTVLVCGAQMGKTETELDLIGAKLDQRPAPILYAGPSKEFVTDQFEPRLMELFDQAPTLKRKLARGKRNKKTQKWVGGVKVRLAHAGSSTALKSDPFALALVDEYDEMLSNVRGQGDPLGLIEARGDTYADATIVVTSTPSQGTVEVQSDPESGLEFWKVADPNDVESPIWKLWQSGTRYHWAWPCPHCDEFFIPRFKHLSWPKHASPAEARRSARMVCPHCGTEIEDAQKEAMNARGVYVAPGQRIVDGDVLGDPPDSSTASFWVSGLASPFVPFGERVERYLTAQGSGEKDKIQTAVNAGFGELYSLGGGDAPVWSEVAAHRASYRRGEVPEDVVGLTMGVDVQKMRLIWTTRGWGPKQSSALIDFGEIWGRTEEDDVWQRLSELLDTRYDGLPIRRAYIDSGYRPNSPSLPSEHRVYAFCRQHSRVAVATKGYAKRSRPIEETTIDVTVAGGKAKYGLPLALLDTDFFKSWVHDKVRSPLVVEGQMVPGAWRVPSDVTEEYCRQVVAEARIRKPSGALDWVRLSRENHFLDCEALAYAAAYSLGVARIGDEVRRPPKPAQEDPTIPKEPTPPKPKGLAALATLNRMGR